MELKSAQNDHSQATSSYKRLQPLVAYCQANHTTNDCKSSKGVELDEVMQVCCGAKAKRCAAGKLPKNCSSVCSGAFLPYALPLLGLLSHASGLGARGRSLVAWHRQKTCQLIDPDYYPSLSLV